MSGAPAPRTQHEAQRWQMPRVPAHWSVVPGWGVRGVGGPAAGSNICLGEDTLLAGKRLEPYVRTQMTVLRRQFADPQLGGPSATELLAAAGADEAALLLIRHRALHGREVVQIQAYGRLGLWIGIVTLTTLREQVGVLRGDFESFLGALRIAAISG